MTGLKYDAGNILMGVPTQETERTKISVEESGASLMVKLASKQFF